MPKTIPTSHARQGSALPGDTHHERHAAKKITTETACRRLDTGKLRCREIIFHKKNYPIIIPSVLVPMLTPSGKGVDKSTINKKALVGLWWPTWPRGTLQYVASKGLPTLTPTSTVAKTAEPRSTRTTTAPAQNENNPPALSAGSRAARRRHKSVSRAHARIFLCCTRGCLNPS